MEAILKTIGGVIVLFFCEAVFIILVMAVGRLLDAEWLERWFYCRIHSVISGVRRVKAWKKEHGRHASARRQDCRKQ